MNGPVARAGSILFLFKINGMNVPNRAAKIITVNSDMLTSDRSFNAPCRAYSDAKTAPASV